MMIIEAELGMTDKLESRPIELKIKPRIIPQITPKKALI
jgi:hypothetical protein